MMPSEFEENFDHFASELGALSELASMSGAAGATSARARIAAGNGATLLLAATFEDFIREQVKSVFQHKLSTGGGLADFPDKLVSVVWRRSLETLARSSFDDLLTDSSAAISHIESVTAFCFRGELTDAVSDALAHNDVNMRPSEIGRLFNQIGLKSIIAETCANDELIGLFGAGSAGKTTAEVETFLEDFFRRRNAIAHSLGKGSSSGPVGISRDIELIGGFGKALTATLIRLLGIGTGS